MKYIRTLECTLVRDHAVQLDLSGTDGYAVARYVHDFIGNADREHLLLLVVNTRGRVTGVHTVSIGTVSATLAHPREVFKVAILGNASAIILAHNHPSNEVDPSDEDIRLTKCIEQAGQVLGIELFDHLIVGSQGWSSLKTRKIYRYGGAL